MGGVVSTAIGAGDVDPVDDERGTPQLVIRQKREKITQRRRGHGDSRRQDSGVKPTVWALSLGEKSGSGLFLRAPSTARTRDPHYNCKGKQRV